MHGSKLFVPNFAVWCLISLCLTMAANAQVNKPLSVSKQLVFTVFPTARGVNYKVANTSESDPLRGLGQAIEKYGDEVPVVCLIDSRLPVRLIAEASALAGKAGFRNVRTFALDHSTGKISEVKFGPWVSMTE